MQDYIANGRRMTDVIGVSYDIALRDLPVEEANDFTWPYPRIMVDR